MFMLALLLSWGYTYLVSTFSASAPSEHSNGDDWEDEFIDDRQEVMTDLGLSFMDWDSDISEDGLSEGSTSCGDSSGLTLSAMLN